MIQPWIVFAAPLLILAYLAMPWRNRAPLVVTGAISVAGWVVLVITAGTIPAVISLGVAIAVLVALGLLGITSRTTTLAVALPLACLPPGAWLYSGIALAAAAIAGAIATRRRFGKGYLLMASGETLAALGVQGGVVTRPDVSRLPVDAAQAGKVGASTTRRHLRVPLPALLLGANAVGLVVALAV